MSRTKLRVSLAIAPLALLLGMPQEALPLGTSALTGNDLLSHCKAWVRILDDPKRANDVSSDDPVNGAHCVGDIAGIVDELYEWQVSDKGIMDTAHHLCVPDGVTPNQTVRVVAKWLDDHPARLNEPAVRLTLTALKDSFPCVK